LKLCRNSFAERANQTGPQSGDRFQERADTAEQNARVLRKFLIQIRQGAEEAAD